jgi:hypothetical protein
VIAARPTRHGPLNRFGPRAAPTLALLAVTLLYVAQLTLAVRASQGPPIDLTGTWQGTGSDFWVNRNATDGMHVTWVLTQSGSAVSGTVESTPLNATDGSCSSCHRAKGGTVAGTISGTALTLTMDFPGRTGEITPDCSVSFNGTAMIATPSFTTSYTLTDSCEGPFIDGLLTMTRVSTFTDDPLTAGLSVIRAVHVAQLRTRIDAVRGRLNLSPYPYADELTAEATIIRAQHLIDLRTALAEAYAAADRTPPAYTDPDLAAGGFIKAVHIAELRTALAVIE